MVATRLMDVRGHGYRAASGRGLEGFVLLCVTSGAVTDLWVIKQILHGPLPVLCVLAMGAR